MRTLLFVILGTGCSGLWAAGKRPYAVQLSTRLEAPSQAELRKRLGAPFAEGTAHPAGVNNCTELLAKGRAASEEGGPDAAPQKSTLAECLIFRTLIDAAGARSSSVADLKWDEQVMRLLPPELAVNVSDESLRAAKIASARGWKWVDVD